MLQRVNSLGQFRETIQGCTYLQENTARVYKTDNFKTPSGAVFKYLHPVTKYTP